MKKKFKVCLVGLGYVGMPLAAEFSKKFKVFGYDISQKKIENLKKGIDETQQYKKKDLNKIYFSSSPKNISSSEFIIVCIPTPVDRLNKPDLKKLKLATQIIGKNLSKGSTVIFESTVYPGVTENICLNILEKYSKLKVIKHFNIGYSPERVNPGDKKNTLSNIVKIVSGNNLKTLNQIKRLYKSIIKNIYPVSSIKIAEASKVIENTQRDVNIGLINEFSLILNKLNLNVKEVLDAARTKWNFLKFEPGLVGGHCIGVDPYYLAYIAKKTKIKPRVILSSRDVNEKMTNNLFLKIIKKLNKKDKLLVFGATFKENCPDLRNSKNLELIKKFILSKYDITVNDEFIDVYNLKQNNLKNYFKDIKNLKTKKFDFVLILVKHDYLLKSDINFYLNLLNKNGTIFDFKNLFTKENKIIFKQKKINYINF